jgi:hypothetical protein
MKRWQAAVLAGILLVLLGGYAAGWHVLANQLGTVIPLIPQQAAQYGITVDGKFSRVKGFPFTPEIDFSGRISGPAGGLVVPQLTIQGLPLPGRTLEITMLKGAHLDSAHGDLDSDLWSVHDLTLTCIVPPQIPREATAETLRAWRDAGGKIDIRSFSLHKETLKVEGSGTLSLDDQLQPAGNFDARIKGYNDFIGYLKNKHVVKKKQTYIIQAILGAFAKQDMSTGENYLDTALTLQTRRLSLGPLEVFTVPEVVWPATSTPPASP